MTNQVHALYGNRLRVRACGLLVENESLLMVNHRSLSQGDFWSLPGGGVDFGESITTALLRETREETGLQAEAGEFLFACEFIKKPLHAIELFFRLNRTGGLLQTGFDPEMKTENQIIKDVRFLSWKEIQKMDAQSVHGIFRFVKQPVEITGLHGYFKL